MEKDSIGVVGGGWRSRVWEYRLELAIALVPLVLALAFGGRYGYFRDELYYIACSNRLDWGFVDHPPLSILLLWLNRSVFGDSLVALHWLPALAVAATIVLTAVLARALGAGRRGRVIAALAAAGCPLYLSFSGSYSMNAFDILFWTMAMLAAVRAVTENRPRLWLVFGLCIGLGLQNKYSIGFLAVCLSGGLLLSRERRQLAEKHFWWGAALAFTLFLPHLVWQVVHHFPSLEFMHNASSYKNMPLSPLALLLQQWIIGPLQALVWLAGLFALLRRPAVRYLGYTFLLFFTLMALSHAKPYYLGPIYPVLFAAGGTIWERWSERSRLPAVGLGVLLVASAVMLSPFALPVLPVQDFLRYQSALGLKPPQEERSAVGPLSQFYADRFGWREWNEVFTSLYQRLSPAEQRSCFILVRNYGEAAALEFFGRGKLPPVLCGHNSYWYWADLDQNYSTAIVVGVSRDTKESLADLRPHFDSVEPAAGPFHPLAMPFENHRPIFICRGARFRLRDMWPRQRSFI